MACMVPERMKSAGQVKPVLTPHGQAAVLGGTLPGASAAFYQTLQRRKTFVETRDSGERKKT